MKLVGYANTWSAQPGQTVTFMVSSEPATYTAELVRLIHGDQNPAGPGFKAEPVKSSFAGEYSGAIQPLLPGSYVRVADPGALSLPGDFTLQMWIRPTMVDKEVQTLVSCRGEAGSGYALRLEGGRLTLELGDQRVSSAGSVLSDVWSFVVATYDRTTGRVELRVDQRSGVIVEPLIVASGTIAPSTPAGDGELLIGAELADPGAPAPTHFYNGKIEAPRIYDRVLTPAEVDALSDGRDAPTLGDAVAAWDFSAGISTWTVTDVSRNDHHGAAVNQPMRAATGRSWDGSVMDWTQAPWQYGAIHFHDDDLSDAGWEPSFRWTIPDALPSGVYAARVSAGDDEDFIPIIVVPHLGRPAADMVLVLPTFSYLAYANEQMANDGTLAGVLDEYPRASQDAYIVANGLRGCYDRHTDGSSVCYSSWLRPIVNMRPTYHMPWLDDGRGSPHQFPADLHLVDWLVTMGYRFDIITDLELHRDGVARLRDYRVALTGTHAEYSSTQMIDAYQGYLNGGGRLMYLSGNGMWWVAAPDPTSTGIEVRRRGSPIWNWPAAPGEAFLSSTGEPAGTWSARGRDPQRWLGIGMNSEGATRGRPYQRRPGSFDPRAAFVFEGIGDDELIGDFPCLVSSWGAAGFEIDYADARWGTPEHTLVLATAEGFEGFEITGAVMVGGPSQFPEVRADMVLLEYPNGGAVFGTGSISWCACLSYNGYDNNVSRLNRNVLDAFLADTLPGR
jgi:N,N-dimethylformamidase